MNYFQNISTQKKKKNLFIYVIIIHSFFYITVAGQY